ncbi:translation initiation factor 3 subunit [Saccharomycopsis crataegensis]|uniref:Translation initiation factor 3 subunit n=1 Tax=Saccharomycopsis crataegensis TaxID=43959 RepID=A0AAV5QF80_9ASCO|nr:translation initiation factor 3 subunit [Saccharomycopsis crataegensis]
MSAEQGASSSENAIPESTIPNPIAIEIALPANEQSSVISFQSSANETIDSISQNITIMPSTSHLTCFNLVLPGSKVPLDENVTMEELLQDESEGVKLELVEKNYTLKTVREHVMKIRENCGLLQFDNSDPLGVEYSGIDSGSTKFSELHFNEKKFEKTVDEKTEGEKDDAPQTESYKLTNEDKKEFETLKSAIVEGSDASAEDLLITKNPAQLKPALKNMSLSGWNPVSSYSKLNEGHLLYLQVQTLEGDNHHITATINGFYLNNSSNSRFDPSLKTKNLPHKKLAAQGNKKFHSLYNLIQLLSEKFNEVEESNRDLLMSTNPLKFLIPTNSFLSNPWIADRPSYNQQPDFGKTQIQFLVGGSDSGDLLRSWNDDYQQFIDFPKANLTERIARERLLNKTGFEFATAATKTAVAIINGDIPALDISETNLKDKIFLRNNIFYSFAIDSSNQYANAGGEEAARYAAKKDLVAIKKLNNLDDGKVKYAMTTIVDYAGYRVVCQAPIPGVFNQVIPLQEEDFDENGQLKSEELSSRITEKVAYGFGDEFNKINDTKLFEKSFKTISDYFHLKKHTVWSQSAEGEHSNVTELVTSLDTKGLKGSDDRLYIIDMYKTTPLDIKFIEENCDESKEDSYPFRQVLLRHELVDEWFRRNVAKEIKAESEKLSDEDKSQEDGPKITVDAAKFTFNPDAFSLKGKPEDLSAEQLKEVKEDEDCVRQLGDFLHNTIIEEFLADVFTGKAMVPLDGEHLTETLHKQGINLRHLGLLAKKILESKAETEEKRKVELEQIAKDNELKEEEDKKKEAAKKEKEAQENDESKETTEEAEEAEEDNSIFDMNKAAAAYNSFYKVIVQEVIARTSKHVLRSLTDVAGIEFAPSIVSHFLNLLFGFEINSKPEFKLQGFLESAYDLSSPELAALNEKLSSLSTCDALIALVSREAFKRFRLELSVETIKKFIAFNPISLLREISMKFGIQLLAKDYAFDEATFEKFAAATAVQPATSSNAPVSNSKAKKNKKKNNATTPLAQDISKPQNTIFTPSNVLNLVPKINDCTFESSLAQEILNTGREYIYSTIPPSTEEDAEKAAKQREENVNLGVSLVLESLSLQEQVYGSIHPKIAEICSTLSNIYAEIGQVEVAIDYAKRSLIVGERVYGIDSYKVVLSLLNLAFLQNINGSQIASIETYQRILDILKLKSNNSIDKEISEEDCLLASMHPLNTTVISNIGFIYSSLGLFENNIDLYGKAIELSEKFNGKESNVTMILRRNLSQLYLESGQFSSALREYNKLNHLLKKNVGLRHPITKESYLWMERLVRYTYETGKYNKMAQQSKAKQSQTLQAQTSQAQQQQQPAPSKKKNKKKKKKTT